MSKIKVTWVSPCCGRRLQINNVDDIVVEAPYQFKTAEGVQLYWSTNAQCCGEIGNGMYASRAAAEADLDRIKQNTILASIRWSWEDLHKQHAREIQEMTDAVEDFTYNNSEQAKRDSAGPGYREGHIPGYNEACGYWE